PCHYTLHLFFFFILTPLYIFSSLSLFLFFFYNATSTTDIYTLSLHDALPISRILAGHRCPRSASAPVTWSIQPFLAPWPPAYSIDRKSTRLNSSHGSISYAVFCLKKKKKK